MSHRFAIVFISLLPIACTAELNTSDEPESGAQEAIGVVERAYSCPDNSGVNPTKASLAVAMANELGEWDPLLHLQNGTRVELSPLALSLCSERGGCALTTALLALQNDDIRNYIDQSIFNPTVFREELRASFERQLNIEDDLRRNRPSDLPTAALLNPLGPSVDFGGCGAHYGWEARLPDGSAYPNPWRLSYRLGFFGGTTNPFIDFREGAGIVYVDPAETDFGMIELEGDAIETPQARLFDPSRQYTGRRCIVATESGTWTGRLTVLDPDPAFSYCKAL
jgi:hypothetical protein